MEGAHWEGAKEERLREILGLRHPLDHHAPVGVHKVLRTGEPELVAEISEAWLRVAARDPKRARIVHELGGRSGMVVPFVAHDLRNPLGTISMTAELLLETTPQEDEATRGKFEIISRSAQRMNRLIQDLLDVARIEAGQRLAIEPQREEVAPLMAEACEMLRPHAENKGLRLSCEVPEPLPAVRADRDRILQVFSNLIGNALKVTEHGAVTVQAEPMEGAVRFAVSDTGPGISAPPRW